MLQIIPILKTGESNGKGNGKWSGNWGYIGII